MPNAVASLLLDINGLAAHLGSWRARFGRTLKAGHPRAYSTTTTPVVRPLGCPRGRGDIGRRTSGRKMRTGTYRLPRSNGGAPIRTRKVQFEHLLV